MVKDLHLTPSDLAAFDLPSPLVAMLTSVAIPSWFDRLEVECDSTSLRVETRGVDAFVVLGTADSGRLAVRVPDGSVWWLLSPRSSGPTELHHLANEQFVNSDLYAFARCVDASRALLADGTANDLRQAIDSIDPAALSPENEGVWRDTVLDREAGL